MSRGIFGWDLPPGVSVSDIPGNRPEDGRLEEIELAFYENTETNGRKRFTPEEWKYLGSKKRTTHLEDIIWKAIEYGMDIAREETRCEIQSNKVFDKLAVMHAFEDVKTLDNAKKKVIEYLGLEKF
jgi:viroplasmin and RNaseH domain-containing protein